MAFTVERAFLNAVTYTSADFAAYHEKVFGSTGTFAYTTQGLTLIIQSGGLLMGGYFYKVTGEVRQTLSPNQIRYVVAKKAKNNDADPEFFLADSIREDDGTDYVATVFRVVANATSLEVERIGGYPTALYRAINGRLDNVVKVFSGSANPENTLGRNGDVYIKY